MVAKGTARERRCAMSPLPSAECLSAKPRGIAKSLEHAATRSSSAATHTPRPTPWQQLSSIERTLPAYSWASCACASRSASTLGCRPLSEGESRPTAGAPLSPLAGFICFTTEAWS